MEPGTSSLEAYTLCLKGRYHSGKRTPEGFKLAIGYFEQAIGLDFVLCGRVGGAGRVSRIARVRRIRRPPAPGDDAQGEDRD